MSIEISYWNGRAYHSTQAYRQQISAQSLAITGTSAQSNATPSGAVIVRLEATEACRFDYGTDPTASATTPYLGAGQVIEFQATPGNKVAGKTA